MKFYKMSKPAGKWVEITEETLLKVINAHFDEKEQTTWDGHNKPSRAQVIEFVKSGKTLHLYSADYKVEGACNSCNLELTPACPIRTGLGCDLYEKKGE